MMVEQQHPFSGNVLMPPRRSVFPLPAGVFQSDYLPGRAHMMRSSRIILFLFVFLAGGLAGYLVRDRVTSDPCSPLNYASIRDSRFKYTHPLLDVLLAANAPQNTGLRPFKTSVEKLIREDMDRKWADTVAIYFRDLNNGPWFSIGEMN